MILYLDTETTGLYPGNICQLSYIMQDKKDIFAKNLFFAVDNVDYGAYCVHGLSVSKLKILSDGKRFSDKIAEIKTDFNKADVVVSHNTAFDFMFLRAEFDRSGEIFSTNKDFCSMKNNVSVCKLPKTRGRGYKYPKLNELCNRFAITDYDVIEKTKQLFGEDIKGFHDARFDTTAVFLAVNEEIRHGYNIELEDFL